MFPEIRRASIRDYPVVAALSQRLDYYHHQRPTYLIPETLAVEDSGIFIAGSRYGFIHVVDDTERDDAMYVASLFVQAWCRRRYIGTALLNRAFLWGENRQHRYVRLHVWDANTTARAFYGRMGFNSRDDALIRKIPPTNSDV